MQDYLISLVKSAFESLEKPNQVSLTTRTCIRIAGLRNDFENQWWLEYEFQTPFSDTESAKELNSKYLTHFPRARFLELLKRNLEGWEKERKVQLPNPKTKSIEEKIIPMTVSDLESTLEQQRKLDDTVKPPPGLTPIDLYFENKESQEIRLSVQINIGQISKILDKIKNRLHDFLSNTEKQLFYGQIQSDIFRENRAYVELRLGQVAPEALEKILEAYKRMEAKTPEAFAHALTSCRRGLKDLADKLYPPIQEPKAGMDGKLRVLTEEMYVARLWQFVFESMRKSTATELLKKELEDLGGRIDKLYELSCKGVHASVDEFEVNQCVIKTFILIGDLLRIYDKALASDL